MKYIIITFGCAANVAQSEQIAGYYHARGYRRAKTEKDADEVVIMTCMIRESAQNRVYGLLRNLGKFQEKHPDKKQKIIVTGCLVGMAVRDKKGTMLRNLQKKFPVVSEFVTMEELGFTNPQLRSDKTHALVLISNGCNNYCSYCVVPYARGPEVSRPVEDIIDECKQAVAEGRIHMTLIGQNVNSYGADLIKFKVKSQKEKDGKHIERQQITYVKHLGKMRIPTMFPYLLDQVARIKGLKTVDFISSNPWDFSDELIDVIAANKTISRQIHLPVQSGDEEVLKKMNRWYTPREYMSLIRKIQKKVSGVTFSTDIIVGFCTETEKQFEHTVSLCKKIGFTKAYISIYSDRPMTVAHKTMTDDVPYAEKKRRWELLDELINKTNLRKGTYK